MCIMNGNEMGQGKVVTNGLGQFLFGMGQIFYLQNKDKEARQYLKRSKFPV